MQFRNSMKEPVPLDFKEDMKHVYFDVAGFPVNKQLHDLLLDVSVSGKTVCYKDLPLNAKEKASRNFRKLISKLYSAVFK